jgi:transposase-like protein
MSKRPNISAEDQERIVSLRLKRWNIPSIAKEIGCSEGTVSWHLLMAGIDLHENKPLAPVPVEPIVCGRNGYIVRRFTQAEDSRLLALEAEGLNLNRVAKALGRKRNAILGRLATLSRRDARAEALGQ